PQWRGWGCITGGLAAFMLLGQYGGLVPATLGLVFISALGDRQHTIKSAALLAVGVTLLGVAIFSWGLQLQFPLFRWG
ncbi:tripartite tricarboxylate transporter TctB family protein, partial [Bordetella hinzii]|nr:tripartite tricarboxylate transporter TctB family protein [Bordetella hinzii]